MNTKKLAIHFSLLGFLAAALSAGTAGAQTIVNIGSQSGNTVPGTAAIVKTEVLAYGWIRSDNAGSLNGGESAFIGTGGSSDFRAYVAFDLSSFAVTDLVSLATVSLYSEGADSFDANGPSTTDANSIGLNITQLANVTGYGPGNRSGVGGPAATIDSNGLGANWTNLNGLYGSVIQTVALDLDAIAPDAQVDFDVTAAVQAAVSAGASKITFGFTSPAAIATGARNFFPFEGMDQSIEGGGAGTIGPNLRVEFSSVPSVFVLTITPNGANYDFSWNSQPGKLYDLLSSTDLSTPIAEWAVYDPDGPGGTDPYENIADTGATTTLTNVVSGDPRRFFAMREK